MQTNQCRQGLFLLAGLIHQVERKFIGTVVIQLIVFDYDFEKFGNSVHLPECRELSGIKFTNMHFAEKEIHSIR